jgi:hypothetical protein
VEQIAYIIDAAYGESTLNMPEQPVNLYSHVGGQRSGGPTTPGKSQVTAN